ncbi:MAG: hypothetical protein AAF515_10275 [Pseudomonadota bacterium]
MRIGRQTKTALGALVCATWLAIVDVQAAHAAAAGAEDSQAGAAAADATPPDDRTPNIEAPPSEAELTGRPRYNQGVAALADGDSETAATAFLAARDTAGADATLRFSAAYNLGLALAEQADAATEEPETALERLREAAAWFSDAVRLGDAGDEDARVNLEIVMRRILELTDSLGQRDLAARLDRIIDDQRGLRDQTRRLLVKVAEAGADAEPVAFERDFTASAERERSLLAEATAIAELGAEERAAVEAKGEDAEQQERLRAAQLAGLDHHLEQARQSMSDTRRWLRRLDGNRAHRRADAALAELKRAREQLTDPITVLRGILRDQLGIGNHTAPLAARSTLDANAPPPPAWLTAEHLADRQDNAAVRVGEMLARFEGAQSAETEEADEQTRRTLRAAEEATPLLDASLTAMNAAREALGDGNWTGAMPRQFEAIDQLNRAIERFAGLRELIEFAYADQSRLVAWLTPNAEDGGGERPTGDALAEAGRIISRDNLDRLTRLEPLLVEELSPAPAANAAPPDEAQREQQQAQLEAAEKLRADAVAAIERSRALLPDGAARVDADAARAALEELRRLFFTIVEHLQELLAAQTDTHDATAAGFSLGPDDLPAALGAAATNQAEHAGMADALANALARQADAQPPVPGQTQQEAPAGPDLATATAETRKAAGRMQTASVELTAAAAAAGSMSPVLEPILEDQQAAMTHIENALRALQPPQQNDGGDSEQSESGGQQQPQPEQLSERQARQRLQAIRDRDAERQRDREAAEGTREPVEKDW